MMQIKVLVVEDDFLIADDHSSTIQAKGWQVLGPASSVEQAFSLLAAETPTVATLDLMLRHGLSTPIAEALIAKGIPFVVVSGSEDAVAVGGLAFQGILNVGKPTDPTALVAGIESAIAKAGQ